MVLLLMAAPRVLGGQHGAPPQVHQLPEPEATSPARALRAIGGLRVLPDGSVLVNDVLERRLVQLSRNLKIDRVVIDANTPGSIYGNATGLFSGLGDSTFFLSGKTLSMAVIDARGRFVRTMAPPRPSDFGQLVGGPMGTPGFDALRRLVYRGEGKSFTERVREGRQNIPAPPESVPLVRFDFTSRQLDTITFLRVYSTRIFERRITTTSGRSTTVTGIMEPVMHPIPTIDDWAVLADGRVAVVRGVDYHVDIFGPGGERNSGGKIPFDWRHLNDAAKAALIDSTRAMRARLAASGYSAGSGYAPPPGSVVPVGGSVVVSTGSGGGSPPGGPTDSLRTERYVDPSELPDYQPVFAAGGVRADADGFLWVRTIPPTPTAGGAVYDVIDGTGILRDRVQVPRGTVIAGFGLGGVVLLARRDGPDVRLMRVQYRLPKD